MTRTARSAAGRSLRQTEFLRRLTLFLAYTRDERGRLSIRIDCQLVAAVVETTRNPELPHGDWVILAFE